ncbi:MAG TPA: hypothetical protein VIG29_22120, partial [Vicinamibacteria bacterium]
MSRGETVLCRGFRGVSSFTTESLRTLSRADPFAPARSLVVLPTSAASHLFRRQLEDALLADGGAAVFPTLATSGNFIPLLMERSSSAQALVDPLLREALLEKAFAEVQDRGIAPPFRLHGGLARRVLDLHDEILGRSPLERTEGGLEDFFARAFEELEDPEDEGARKLAAQTRFLQAAIEAYRSGLVQLGLLDIPSARLGLQTERFPFERAYVLGNETLGVADLDLLSKAPALSELYLVVPNGERQAPPRLLTPGAGELAFVARDREEAFTDAARLLKLLEEDGRLPPLHRIGVVVP